jgi:hypothetical protein
MLGCRERIRIHFFLDFLAGFFAAFFFAMAITSFRISCKNQKMSSAFQAGSLHRRHRSPPRTEMIARDSCAYFEVLLKFVNEKT